MADNGKKVSELPDVTDARDNDLYVLSRKEDGKYYSKSTNFYRLKTNVTESVRADIAGIREDIADVKRRLDVIEGQVGLLNEGTVRCYTAPKADWFVKNGFSARTDSDGRTYYEKDGAECSYGYGMFYPGDDENLESQYGNYNASGTGGDQWRYPLFTLNAAMSFLGRFRSNGTVTYWVVLQFGDYEYFGEDYYQDVFHPDAKGQSVLRISPMQSQTQLELLRCATDPGCVEDGTFRDSDLVRTRFVWQDEPEKPWTAWFSGIKFRDTKTYLQGVGLRLIRTKDPSAYDTSGLTVNSIMVDGGFLSLKQCVLRNASVSTQNGNAATVQFSRLEYNKPVPSGPSPTPDYDLDNLGKYAFPTVFVDDPPPEGMTSATYKRGAFTMFVSTFAGDGTLVYFYGAYVVFASGRPFNAIRISASNKALFLFSYDMLSKLVFRDRTDDGTESATVPFNIESQATLRYQQQSYPSSAKNKEIHEQFRISLSYDPKPAWLTSCKSVTTSTQGGYNPATGIVDNAYGILTKDTVLCNGEPTPPPAG